MKDYDYGKFTFEHLRKIEQGINEFNSGNYWQCHEEIEDIWLDSAGDDARYVYWVVIQLATCLYHWEDKNINGAAGMIKKAKLKLDCCEKRKVETDVAEKFLHWSKLKDVVKSIPEDSNLTDFLELSQFRFPSTSLWPKKD